MIPNNIDTRAPVISRHSVVIDTPLDVVWRLHTDVDAWPDWQPDIETARPDEDGTLPHVGLAGDT